MRGEGGTRGGRGMGERAARAVRGDVLCAFRFGLGEERGRVAEGTGDTRTAPL